MASTAQVPPSWRARAAAAIENVPVNVGTSGGDLATRRVTLGVVAVLTVSALPPLGISDSTLKIMALLAAMSGTLFLMAGLVFLQKTHYAGVALVPGPLLMLGLRSAGHGWLAALVGLLLCGAMLQNLVSKRCGVNHAFGINSCAHGRGCSCPPGAHTCGKSTNPPPAPTPSNVSAFPARPPR